MTFSVPSGGGNRPLEEDPYGAVGFAARVQDAMNAFPQAHGVIIDGPGEKHYELAYHHGGELFEIRESEQFLAHLGVDIDRLKRGIGGLRSKLLSEANIPAQPFPQLDAGLGALSRPRGDAGGFDAV